LLEKQKKEGTRFIKLVVEKAYVTDNDLVVAMGRVLNTPPVNVARSFRPGGGGPGAARHGQQLQSPARFPAGQPALPGHGRSAQRPGGGRCQAHDQAGGLPLIASEKAILDKLANLDTSRAPAWRTSSRTRQAGGSGGGGGKSGGDQGGDRNTDLAQLAASSEEAPVIKLANLILVQAIKDRASDIHIEPFENMVRLRYRIDGGLIDMPPPPKNLQVALASRIKVMSSLDIAERRLPQDGRMRVRWAGGTSICASPSCPPSTAKNASCACWTNPTSPPAWTSWASTRRLCKRFKPRWTRRTA
jgi:type IV pilus assembly protein PilB